MTVVGKKDPNVVVGRVAAEAFVNEAKGAAGGRLHEEYAAFLGTLAGGAREAFNDFVQKNAPDVAAALKLPPPGVSAKLQEALQRAFDGAGASLRWSPSTEKEPKPFYGAHFSPFDVELSGQKFRVYVSAEEQKFGPPSTPEQSGVAILRRSDGALSSDLHFRVSG